MVEGSPAEAEVVEMVAAVREEGRAWVVVSAVVAVAETVAEVTGVEVSAAAETEVAWEAPKVADAKVLAAGLAAEVLEVLAAVMMGAGAGEEAATVVVAAVAERMVTIWVEEAV